MSFKLRKQQPGEHPVRRYFSLTSILVPVLLLSILFVKMAMDDQPSAVKEAIAKDKANVARRLHFVLYLLDTRDARIQSEEGTLDVKAVNGKFDVKGIHGIAVSLKQKYPEVFNAILNVTSKISKKEIKIVLESIRKRDKTDPEIFIVDERSGKKVLLKVMFTDVVVQQKVEG